MNYLKSTSCSITILCSLLLLLLFSVVVIGNGNTALHESVLAQDYTRIIDLLKTDLRDQINSVNDQGKTPLYYALEMRNSDLVFLLLSYGADPSVEDSSGATPLHKAVKYKLYDVIGKLIELGADPGKKSERAISPLSYAFVRNDFHMLGLLLHGGTDPGFTLLEWAVIQRDYTMIKELINKYFIQSSDLVFAIKLAQGLDFSEITSLLTLRYCRRFLEAELQQERQANKDLLSGLLEKNPVIRRQKVQRACDQGADPNCYVGKSGQGRCPLHYAVFHNDPKLINILVRAGANSTIQDDNGFVPLDYALFYEAYDSAKLLVALSAVSTGMSNSTNVSPNASPQEEYEQVARSYFISNNFVTNQHEATLI